MSETDPRTGPLPPTPSPKGGKLQGVLGLGLDDDGGHHRLTKGPDFRLVGGSAETHERMTDLVMRMREKLKKSGKSFGDLDRREFEDLARDSL